MTRLEPLFVLVLMLVANPAMVTVRDGGVIAVVVHVL